MTTVRFRHHVNMDEYEKALIAARVALNAAIMAAERLELTADADALRRANAPVN